MDEDPKIIDVEFEDVTPPRDRRPFWQKYRLTFDWKWALIGALIGGLTALRLVLEG